MALRGWDSGNEPHSGIKTSSMAYWSSCGSDQAMCLEELLVVADGSGVANGELPRGVVLPSFFLMTHMDSATQNIQLV